LQIVDKIIHNKYSIIDAAVESIKLNEPPQYDKEIFDLHLTYNSDGSIPFGYLVAKDKSIVLGFRNLSIKSLV